MTKVKECYETCPGKDEQCELFKDYEPYLDGKDCTVYSTIKNDIDKLHQGKENITYSVIEEILETINDVQFHIDKQGLILNAELMYKCFQEQYRVKSDKIILKDQEKYIMDNVWDTIDAKTESTKKYDLFKKIKW